MMVHLISDDKLRQQKFKDTQRLSTNLNDFNSVELMLIEKTID